MKILYGVTGCGLGHTMRARALAQHLEARGHIVKLSASGRAVEILRGHGLDVCRIDGMTMRFAEGGARRAKSAYELLKQAPHATRFNAEVAWNEVLDFRPDLCITDFDSFTPIIGALLRRPVISVDHQHVLDRFRHPGDVKDRVSWFDTARVLVTAKTPRCDHYIVTSFFFPEARWENTSLVGPILRREVEAAHPTEGDHVLVYQTTTGDPRLIPALQAAPHQKFVLYGLGRDERLGNVELRPFDEACFVKDLASCRAVIANGGFTTLSEAVYLGKPVLSIPVRRQPEQELNAAWLAHLRLGMRARRVDEHVVRRFLERLGSFGNVRDARIGSGTNDAKNALDRAIAVAA